MRCTYVVPSPAHAALLSTPAAPAEADPALRGQRAKCDLSYDIGIACWAKMGAGGLWRVRRPTPVVPLLLSCMICSFVVDGGASMTTGELRYHFGATGVAHPWLQRERRAGAQNNTKAASAS